MSPSKKGVTIQGPSQEDSAHGHFLLEPKFKGPCLRNRQDQDHKIGDDIERSKDLGQGEEVARTACVGDFQVPNRWDRTTSKEGGKQGGRIVCEDEEHDGKDGQSDPQGAAEDTVEQQQDGRFDEEVQAPISADRGSTKLIGASQPGQRKRTAPKQGLQHTRANITALSGFSSQRWVPRPW